MRAHFGVYDLDILSNRNGIEIHSDGTADNHSTITIKICGRGLVLSIHF
jgi:hypothetical protein